MLDKILEISSAVIVSLLIGLSVVGCTSQEDQEREAWATCIETLKQVSPSFVTELCAHDQETDPEGFIECYTDDLCPLAVIREMTS